MNNTVAYELITYFRAYVAFLFKMNHSCPTPKGIFVCRYGFDLDLGEYSPSILFLVTSYFKATLLAQLRHARHLVSSKKG